MEAPLVVSRPEKAPDYDQDDLAAAPPRSILAKLGCATRTEAAGIALALRFNGGPPRVRSEAPGA